MRVPRPFLLLALTLPLAACGGSSPSSDSAAPSAPDTPAASPLVNNGKLSVGATGSGIGSAATGDSGGLRILDSQPVPGTPNTASGVGAGASCENADLMPTADNLADVEKATLCLLNGERTDVGLRNLKENAKLARAAIKHSQAMVADQFFDHVGEDGSDPVGRIRATGYIPQVGVWTVGENLAWGTGSLATPKAIVAAWMKSSGHKENILRPDFKEIGFGLVAGNPRSDSGDGATYTTTFGGVKGAKKPRKARSAKARSARKAKARIAKGRRR